MSIYDNVVQINIDVDDLVESANATALGAWETLENRTSLIDNINIVSHNNQQELDALNNSIDSLQLQLQQALQAAASVSACGTFIFISTHVNNVTLAYF